MRNLVSKLKCAPMFMTFGTQYKSNMLIMNIVLGIDDIGPQLQIRANLVPKLKCAPVFMKCGTQDIFFSFNNVTNFIKGLRNVKTLKTFSPDGYSAPSQISNKEFFEKNMFNQERSTPLYFEMQNHNIEIGTSYLSILSEVFLKKKCLNSWSIQKRIFTTQND